jgi:hypothetical protein
MKYACLHCSELRILAASEHGLRPVKILLVWRAWAMTNREQVVERK